MLSEEQMMKSGVMSQVTVHAMIQQNHHVLHKMANIGRILPVEHQLQMMIYA